jgi:hypothetical protein
MSLAFTLFHRYTSQRKIRWPRNWYKWHRITLCQITSLSLACFVLVVRRIGVLGTKWSKVHPRTVHEGSMEEKRCRSTFSLASAINGVGGQHSSADLPPGKTRYPLHRKMVGPQGRSGRVLKILPHTGFRSPNRVACSESLRRWCIMTSLEIIIKDIVNEVFNTVNVTILWYTLTQLHVSTTQGRRYNI